MANELLDVLNIFNLNNDENHFVGLSQREVDSGLKDSKNNVFAVIYRGGEIFPNGFCIAMSRSWKCESSLFKMHMLDDNVLHLIFHSSKTGDYVLNEGPWNFNNQLLIIHPWNLVMKAPPSVFDAAHFNYCITNLPSWCYTLEIGLKMVSVVKNSRVLEICSSKRRCVGQFFRIRALLWVKKPLCRCIIIEIPETGRVRTSIQYERLPIFYFFCGRIDHIFPHWDILKNSPSRSRLSQGNYQYPNTLRVTDKSQPEISFHMKLHFPMVEVLLAVTGGSTTSTPIKNQTLSLQSADSNSNLEAPESKDGKSK